MTEPSIPEHVHQIIEAIGDEVPPEKRATVRRLVENIWRGGYIDGCVAASCEEAARRESA